MRSRRAGSRTNDSTSWSSISFSVSGRTTRECGVSLRRARLEHAEPHCRRHGSRGDERRVVFESRWPSTRHCHTTGLDTASCLARSCVAVSSPLMWAEALDAMMARVSDSGLDLSQVAAIAGSAQQHGSVYLKGGAAAPADIDPRSRSSQVEAICRAGLRRSGWTRAQRPNAPRSPRPLAAGVLARRTGSRAFERFTGPQIRKFSEQDPAAYAATARIHLVSSFLASLLAGTTRRLDPGDGSGMNLMDLATVEWWHDAVEATAPDSTPKLPPIAPASAVVGDARAVLAGASRLSTGEGDRVVRRQPVQPDRYWARARRTRCDVARDERHGVRSDARAAASTRPAPATSSARRPATTWASRSSRTARSRASGSATRTV